MFVMAEGEEVRNRILNLAAAIVAKAEGSLNIIMPGYTHLQRAQPVRLAHHLMAYFQMFRRDWERFRDAAHRVDEMPLGAAALAGTTFDVDRDGVARELGFSKISQNSMDAVADRDFVAEFLFNSSMVMMHLSRMAEELILWSSQEFGFCTLPEAFCSGSSIMPQKKNPDACELIRGKTGRVYGNMVALLTVLKALPLTYNKDLQEDKEPLFDSLDTVKGSLDIMARMVPGIEFHGDRMMAAAADPTLAATDLADRLSRDGVPFREAHSRIGSIIRRGSAQTGRKINVLPIPGPEEMVETRKHAGGTAYQRVREQIRAARKFLREAGRETRGVPIGKG
jgi:argininosuccinate lyase